MVQVTFPLTSLQTQLGPWHSDILESLSLRAETQGNFRLWHLGRVAQLPEELRF